MKATILTTDHGGHIELVRLVVSEEHRGRGIGTQAVRELQSQGKPIRLEAAPEQGKKRALHRFYKRLGFRPIGTNFIGETVFQWNPT